MNSLFLSVLDAAIIANRDARKRVELERDAVSSEYLKRHHCTVHLNIGRITGKTEAIKRLAKRGDVVLVTNEGVRKHLLRNIPPGSEIYAVDIFTPQKFSKYTGLGREYPRTVWIDEPSLVFADVNRYEMYKLLSSDDFNQTFVMLGE
jgi:hypothetical protein